MIELVAFQARSDVHRMVQQMKANVSNSLDEVKTQLQEIRQNDAYSEFKIMIWRNQLQKLRETLEKPLDIELQDDDQKISLRMIKVVEIGKYHSAEWVDPYADAGLDFFLKYLDKILREMNVQTWYLNSTGNLSFNFEMSTSITQVTRELREGVANHDIDC